MFLQYGAVISTIAVELVVATVIFNFHATLRGSTGALTTNLPIRWFYTGMFFYFLTCLQCAFQVTLTFQQLIHFSDWVVGHAHMVMFGVFIMWQLGIMTYSDPPVAQDSVVQPAAPGMALLAFLHWHRPDVVRPHHPGSLSGSFLVVAPSLGTFPGYLDPVLGGTNRRRAAHDRRLSRVRCQHRANLLELEASAQEAAVATV